TGDTLFKDGVGRTDLSYSSPSDLSKSLRNLKLKIENLKLFPVVVYPGHGESFILSESSVATY
ncbi:MBL fold metallo-hydrolase, partial [Candidatus Collierbacteria bacterium]|nr:MBL fold metallo-hydrolase [Candidatus Collierbacteria bacterium]